MKLRYLIYIILTLFITIFSAVIPQKQPIWYPQYLGLLFSFFLGISLVLWDFNKWLSLFTGLCLFSTFFITQLSPRAVILLWQLDIGCLIAYGISKFNQKQRKIILWSIFIIGLLQYLWLIIQAYNKDPFFFKLSNPKMDDMVGFAGSPDQIGTFFALISPVLFWFYPLLALLGFTGIILSKSSFALVAGIMGVMIYSSFVKRKIFKFLLLLLPILATVFFIRVDKLKYEDFATRFGVWRYAIQSVDKQNVDIIKNGERQIKCNKWFGYGLGNFQVIFPFIPQGKNHFNFSNEKFTHAHNDYIELFFELGYIGAIILSIILGDFILSFIKAIKTQELVMYFSTICIYLLNAMGNFLSQIAVSGLLLIIFYGMYKGALKDGQTSCMG